MKKSKRSKRYQVINNHGFSLIELLVSIAILVIVMVPLMNYFTRSMKMNQKADKLETNSNLASDIMEGLKNIDMEETLKQFNLSSNLTDFSVLPNEMISAENPQTTVMRLSLDASTGDYTAYNPSLSESAYYFSINGFKSDNNVYDALIKMDPQNYRKDETMNNYSMPDLINLDVKANSLLESNGITETDNKDKDEEAFQTFLNRGTDYAFILYQRTLDGVTTPPPYNPDDYKPYTDPQEIKSQITKTMHIKVSQDSGNNQTVDYVLEYHCAWPSDEIDPSVVIPVSSIGYQGKVQNVYLFYQSSPFYQGNEHPSHPDIIKIESQNLSENVNFYVAKQSTDPLNYPDVILERNSDSDHILTFTNLIDSLGNPYLKMMIGGYAVTGKTINRIIDSKKKDRIYDVTILLCEHTDGDLKDKYKKVLYTLQGTREQ